MLIPVPKGSTRRSALVVALPLLALPILALLGGCADLSPAYQRPATPTPAVISGPATASPAAKPTLTPSLTLSGWQDFFADARLKAVIEQALANNRDLRLAVANMAAVRAQYHLQRADQLPSLSAQGGGAFTHLPDSAVGASGAAYERQYSLSADVSAYQVDLFGKVRNLTRAAQDRYFASQQARDAAQITLVSQVASAYLTVGSDRALLKIAQDTLTSGSESLAVTRRRFESGVDSELAVSQAQTVVQQARYDVARLTAQVAQDRNALDLLVGAPVADDRLPTGTSDPVTVLDQLPDAVSASVLLHRPDVLQAEDELRAANANIGAARAAFFPTISLTGAAGLISPALSTLFNGASRTWSYAPSISQPLFDAGANRAGLEYAKAQRDAAVATYEKTVQTAFREVADALAQRSAIDEQLAAQTALTAAAADSLRLATVRYERGADSYQNVLIAQRTYYAARQTLATAELAKRANLVSLYSALGGGLDRPR